jgi:transcriptional regulator with XRE-family HTH domain
MPEEFMELLARNLRQAQAAAQLRQPQIARRMQKLGFRWFTSTVSLAMRAKRRVTAEELIGLSLVLGVTPGRLLRPDDGSQTVSLPSGFEFPSPRLMANDGSVTWSEDDEPVAGATQARELPPDLAAEFADLMRRIQGGQ